MTKGTELESEFHNRGVLRGGILFLRAQDAIALIEAARHGRVRVLGIDAFRLGVTSTQPVVEHSADFSRESAGSDIWTRAADSVRHQPEDLHFEVVLS